MVELLRLELFTEPTSLKRGEGLLGGWMARVGCGEGEGGGGGMREFKLTSTVMRLMSDSNSDPPLKIMVDLNMF